MGLKYKFAEVIKKSELSYRRIAIDTGLSHPTIMRLAKAKSPGDYNVSADILERLCKYFGCKSLNELVEYRR